MERENQILINRRELLKTFVPLPIVLSSDAQEKSSGLKPCLRTNFWWVGETMLALLGAATGFKLLKEDAPRLTRAQRRRGEKPLLSRGEFLGLAVGGLAGIVLAEGGLETLERLSKAELLGNMPLKLKEHNISDLISFSDLKNLAAISPSIEEDPQLASRIAISTAFYTTKMLGRSDRQAWEVAYKVIPLRDEARFASFCGSEPAACVNFVNDEGQLNIQAFINMNTEKQPSVKHLITSMAHETTHLDAIPKIYHQNCPMELDYGVLGKLYLSRQRGFHVFGVWEDGSKEDSSFSIEEELFAERVRDHFFKSLNIAGPETLTGYPQLLQAVVNLEDSESNLNSWFGASMNFEKVRDLHYDGNIWQLHHSLGQAILQYLPYPKFFQDMENIAALGRIFFRVFALSEEERMEQILAVRSPAALTFFKN